MQNRISDKGFAAVPSIREAADETKDDVSETLREFLDQSRTGVERYVASHPAICLAAAAGVGIALGWWIKRK